MLPSYHFFFLPLAAITALLVISSCNASEIVRVERNNEQQRRLMPCKDTDRWVSYEWEGNIRVKLCASIMNQGNKRSLTCTQKLLGMEGHGDGAIVKDACPIACGVCQEEEVADSSTTTQSPNSESSTQSPNSATATSFPGFNIGGPIKAEDNPFLYKNVNSKIKTMTCANLERKQNRGEYIAQICKSEVVSDDNSKDGRKVDEVCPDVCGVDDPKDGGPTTTTSPNSVTTTTSPNSMTTTTSPNSVTATTSPGTTVRGPIVKPEDDPFLYKRNNSKLRTSSCINLKRKRNRGESITNTCNSEVVSDDISKDGKKVSEVCPDACGSDDPIDGGNKADKGRWADDIFQMEVIPIHGMVTPQGTVLGFGTNARGQQRADMYYTIWNPGLGISSNANFLFKHDTGADIFCSNLNVDTSSGNIIIMGGDTRDDKALGTKTVLEFDYETQEMRPHPLGNMNLGRWYPTSINLPDGRVFVIGGKSGYSTLGEDVPEVWDPDDGFKLLPGARTPIMGKKPNRNWWYPPTYVNSLGEIICIPFSGRNIPIYKYSVDGNGGITQIGTRKFRGYQRSPSIMYRIDQVLMIDNDGGMWVIDISLKNPTFRKVNDLGHARMNGSMVMLPDGCVAIFGGSTSKKNGGSLLSEAVYTMQIWDPETNTVYNGPEQKLARLYHSIALILPDGSVLSAGGGAPGPLTNRNGQLYYPYYLFNKNGGFADRPEIVRCPKNIYSKDFKPNKFSGGSFEMKVDDVSRIQKITATKSGASSHAKNCDTRWINLAFKKEGRRKVTVFTADQNIMIGGLWMINIIDVDGVPSKACLTGVNMEVKLQID